MEILEDIIEAYDDIDDVTGKHQVALLIFSAVMWLSFLFVAVWIYLEEECSSSFDEEQKKWLLLVETGAICV